MKNRHFNVAHMFAPKFHDLQANVINLVPDFLSSYIWIWARTKIMYGNKLGEVTIASS